MTKLFDRSIRAGFTLVELIVVIAILGILSGIAIPVYSGYIEKSRLAADYVLLDAAKTSLAAAALEHGVDSMNLTVTLDIDDDDHTIDGIEDVSGDMDNFSVTPLSARRGGGIVFSSLAARPRQYAPVTLSESPESNKAALNESFMKYFAENADTPLNVLWDSESLILSGDISMTMTKSGEGDETVYSFTVVSGESSATINVSKAQIDTLNASTFGDMGMDNLMGEVGNVVGSAMSAVNNPQLIVGLLGDGFSSFMNDLGISASDANFSDELGNALVMYVAKATADDDNFTTHYLSFIGSAATTGAIDGSLIEEVGLEGLLADVAATYGLITGYANSEIGKNTEITYTDETGEHTTTVNKYFETASRGLNSASSGSTGLEMVGTMLGNIMTTEGIYTYMGITVDEETGEMSLSHNSQGMTDLAGYISAMETINGNIDAMNRIGVTSNGFDSGSVTAILNAIYNTNTNTNTDTGGAGE